MDIAKLLSKQLKAADRIVGQTDPDKTAEIAWWQSQIESLAERAPASNKAPEPVASEHPGQTSAA
jgi:hypothetical protein